MAASLAVEPVVSAAATHIQTVLPCIIRVKATAIVVVCKGGSLTAATIGSATTATISATRAAIATYVIAEKQIAQKTAHIALIATVAAIASVASATHICIS